MRKATPKHKPIQTAIVFSDTHVPYQDEQALSVIEQIVRDTQPTHLIHLGDLLDCYSISRFLKDPTRLEGLQEEIVDARRVLQRFADASPKSIRTLFEGNHEARLGKTIASLDGPARELARLDTFQEAMSWPSLLHLGKTKWGWVPTSKQPLTTLIPGFLLKHGSVVRKFSGYTAKGEFEHYHRSGMSGHTHRLSAYHHTSVGEQYTWMETGCTCSLQPEYMNHPNWQNGFAIVSWTDRVMPSVELVHINNGTTLYNGVVYR